MGIIVPQELDEALEDLRVLRLQFFLELKGSIEDLNDFKSKVNSNSEVFIFRDHCSYLLGRFITLELDNFKTPVAFVNELYTLPKLRGWGHAKTHIDSLKNLCTNERQASILLGAHSGLKSFYKKLEFENVDVGVKTSYLKIWEPNISLRQSIIEHLH